MPITYKFRCSICNSEYESDSPPEVCGACGLSAEALAHAFEAGNYANAYEGEDLELAWENHEPKTRAVYRAAFIMGFFGSYELHEIPADCQDLYLEAERSAIGQAVIRAGYTEAKEMGQDPENVPTCPACGSGGYVLGALGKRVYYRCGACDIDYSTKEQ